MAVYRMAARCHRVPANTRWWFGVREKLDAGVGTKVLLGNEFGVVVG